MGRPLVPDIVITSYLGKTPELRAKRLDFHLRQRNALRGMFPDLHQRSICSGYTVEERKALQLHSYEAQHFTKPMKKWEKHNEVLRDLYLQKRLKSVLLLDDDVVPRDDKEGDVEAGMVSCINTVKSWIQYPDQMCAQVAFFACAGLRFDAFYRSNPAIVSEAPPQVVGWAMMVRSDCGILYTRDLVEDPKTGFTNTDTPFRLKCQSEGKVVVKHNRAFFKSFQGKDDKYSTWVDKPEDRKAIINVSMTRMRRMFPQLFGKKSAASTPNRGKGFGLGGQ